ncbi:MAG: ArsR family transcriptional regulator [Candidatus Pacearchaeota archaeon]
MRVDYSWVLRGSQRKKVIYTLTKPKIPSQIREESSLSLNNVSDVLREFRKKGIIKCLNPEQRTGRLYQLTSKGQKLRDNLLEV